MLGNFKKAILGFCVVCCVLCVVCCVLIGGVNGRAKP